MRIPAAACTITLALSLLSAPPTPAAPPQVDNKIRFQFFTLPGTVQVDTPGTLVICMVNNGGAGELSGLDQVLMALPSGTAEDDLLYDSAGLTCTASREPWACGVASVSRNEVLISFWPEGGAAVAEGEAVYFKIDGAAVNGAPGLALVKVTQEIASHLAAKPVSTTLGVFKATPAEAGFFETDPTVAAHVKDGVSWRELQEMPADFADGKVHWGEIGGMPPALADGTVSWKEVSGIPAALADGIDDGLTAEEDPKVGAATPARIPKWNGARLIDSASINESAEGNVGIGTAAPGEKLTVAGRIKTSGGIVFSDGSEQTTAGVRSEADPSVPAGIKAILQDGGIDFLSELTGVPDSLKDGDQVGLTTETDPSVPAHLKDGVSWEEIAGIPAGFHDGIDDAGIASETDPQVGAATVNRIPKWNGAQLVDSSTIHESGDGRVGIGTTSPLAKLHVDGNIIAYYPTELNHVATKLYVDMRPRINLSTCAWKKVINECSVMNNDNPRSAGCGYDEVMTGMSVKGGEGSCGSLGNYLYIRCCQLN